MADSRRQKFKYDSLNHTIQSIRLIRIRPQLTHDGYIDCEIRHATVNDSYICLSYEWGSENPMHCIVVDSALTWVRQNLVSFLNIARKRHHSKWLWIDALCINQSDVTERNHQVQQMGQIYWRAQEVLCWLGMDVSIAEFVGGQARTRQGTARGLDYASVAFRKSTYWNRAWITQEVVLARRATIMACEMEMDMQSIRLDVRFQEQTRWFNQVNEVGFHGRRRVHEAGALTFDPGLWSEYKGRSLIYLLRECRYKQCYAFQDTVYSLLALCGDGSELRVDYNLTREQLAVQVLASCHRSLCLCAIRIVADALAVATESRTDGAENCPPTSIQHFFAQITLPTSRLIGQPTTIDMRLRDYCSGCEGVVEIHLPEDDTGVPSATYIPNRQPQPDMYFGENTGLPAIIRRDYILKSGFTATLSEDGSLCTLRFTLMALLGLVRLMHDFGGCCDRVKTLATVSESSHDESLLQLCASSVEAWISKKPFIMGRSEWREKPQSAHNRTEQLVSWDLDLDYLGSWNWDPNF